MKNRTNSKCLFEDIARQELEMQFSQYDLKRLEYYARNMADYHLIMDLLPNVSKIYCLGMMGETHFSAVQLVIEIDISSCENIILRQSFY